VRKRGLGAEEDEEDEERDEAEQCIAINGARGQLPVILIAISELAWMETSFTSTYCSY
jgi:hypothetical protein